MRPREEDASRADAAQDAPSAGGPPEDAPSAGAADTGGADAVGEGPGASANAGGGDAGGFANRPVRAEDLPGHAEAPLEPVSPRFAAHRAIVQVAGWAAAAAALWLLPIPREVAIAGAPWAPAALTLLAALAGIWAWMDARRRALGIRERDLIYARGLLVRKTALIPLARIQHVETASGPLERVFGLERLTCFTAGGLGGDVIIRGLERERARRVRHFVLAGIDAQTAPAGEGDGGAAETSGNADEGAPAPESDRARSAELASSGEPGGESDEGDG